MRKTKISILISALVLTSMLSVLLTTTPATSQETPPYLDPTLSPEERALDLLSRMTVDEKVGQMTQIDRGKIHVKSDIANYNLGSLLSGGGSCPSPNEPLAWAQMYNDYQRYAVEDTRLGIPLMYGIDAAHGHNNVKGAVIFPHNVGMGSTWNLNLVEESASITAIEVGATGIDWTFNPCVDVARNDRWGRTYESCGEDPYLCKFMGASKVKGYQGTDLTDNFTIAACAKHYLGSGGTTDGDDQGNCVAENRIIREVHLEPFIGTVEAGTQTIMASFCSINGEKIHGIKYWLTDVLKEELGFNNFIVSDWAAINQVDPNYSTAVKKCINAGIDMNMVPDDYNGFQRTMKNLINDGSIPMSRVDNAVYRILVDKFRLGLFENPYVDESLSSIVGCDNHREVARRAVRESIVLLKNDNILPIPKDIGTIYVAGPNANDIGNQCGGWTITWQGSSGDITPGTTILEAIQNTVSAGTTVIFDESATNPGLYDVGIVVVGETPYAEGQGDTTNLDLPSTQLDIIGRVVNSGTPTVVIMVAGRPRTGIQSKLPEWSAFLMAWLPGTEGQGVADVLFGDYNPSGRLSRSWPKTTAQEPINYDRRPGEAYDPLYEFGYGLSYTTFAYSNLSVTPTNPSATDNITVSVNVKNTGARSGSEVVQVYLNDVVSTLSTPVKKLYRFEKIALDPSQTKTVSFTIPVPELGYYTDTAEKIVEPGTFDVMVGGLTTSFVVGEVDTTPPAAPAGLIATAVSSSQIDLDWANNTEADLAKYEVYRDTTSGVILGPSTFVAETTVSAYSDTGLSASTTYYYVVTAVDTSGNESNPSAEASATTEAAVGETMHVASIDMSLKTRGVNTNAIATVTVVDANGNPVEGATMHGHWEGATTDSDSGTTDASGQVSLDSDTVRKAPSGTTFTFVVDDIVKEGWTYDPTANVETSDSITVP